MESNSLNGKNTRGRDTSATVQPGGEKAGSRASSPSDRNKETLGVDDLASNVILATSIGGGTENERLVLDEMEGSIQQKEKEELAKMNDIVDSMKAAIVRQPNVSKVIQIGIQNLALSLDVMNIQKKKLEMVKQKQLEELKVRSRSTSTTPIKNTKRTATSPAETDSEVKKFNNGNEEGKWTNVLKRKKKENKLNEDHKNLTEKRGSEKPEEDKSKDRKGKLKSKSQALIIKMKDGLSFAEVLKEIQEKVNPSDCSVEIDSIRQTKSGHVLLELGETTKDKETFVKSINETLQDKGSVRCVEPMVMLEIRDIDLFSTEVEVRDALRKAMPEGAHEIKVWVSKENSRQQKLAIVEVPEKEAKSILEGARIKIGWVNCRVRLKIPIMRCFRCFGYGHHQAECKGPNRKEEGICIRCGVKGHHMKVCKNDAKCCLCSEANLREDELKHIPGASRCQVYRRVLDSIRKSQRK